MSTLPDDLRLLHRLIANCTLCPLHKSRTMAVPGHGDPEARVMFVGEAPGFHEDRQGLPFVGAAGHLLDELLQSIGLDRSEVFITNVIKCRPPGNRDPLPAEIEACAPYLDKQVELINPEIIVTLGRFSMARFLGPSASITRVHGQPRLADERIVLPLLHPAAALRQERFRAQLQEGFLVLKRLLSGELPPELRKEPPPGPPPQQLSLF
jgi:uracil-DNA glycosylase family 4